MLRRRHGDPPPPDRGAATRGRTRRPRRSPGSTSSRIASSSTHPHVFRRRAGPEALDRVVALAPVLLLLGRAVVGPIDVAHVVAEPAVGRAGEQRRALAGAAARDGGERGRPDGSTSCPSTSRRRRFRKPRRVATTSRQWSPRPRVLRVEVVLAHEHDRQLPQGGHVHRLVEHALAERALAEERDARPCRCRSSGRERRAGRDRRCFRRRWRSRRGFRLESRRCASTPPLPRQYPSDLPSSSANIRSDPRPFREAVAVAAVRARDLVVRAQRGADSHRDTLFPDVEVGEPRHQRASVELVDLVLERPDQQHPPVERKPQLRACRALELAAGPGRKPLGRRGVVCVLGALHSIAVYITVAARASASRSTCCRFRPQKKTFSPPVRLNCAPVV